ncbi:uncharacterized protein LOC126637129, partial [Myiozetetes cayanensis]|uniref:uncharacterized protein LOC126637129 n=1 Tax=Myiozetetes cayanensis TaxID=478635 RepID=UPI00215E6D93
MALGGLLVYTGAYWFVLGSVLGAGRLLVCTGLLLVWGFLDWWVTGLYWDGPRGVTGLYWCLLVCTGVSSGCRTVTGLYWFVTGLGFLELVGYWFVLGLTGMAPGVLLVYTGAYWCYWGSVLGAGQLLVCTGLLLVWGFSDWWVTGLYWDGSGGVTGLYWCLLVFLGVSSGCRTVTGLYWFVTGLGFLELVGYWFVLGVLWGCYWFILVLTGLYWGQFWVQGGYWFVLVCYWFGVFGAGGLLVCTGMVPGGLLVYTGVTGGQFWVQDGYWFVLVCYWFGVFWSWWVTGLYWDGSGGVTGLYWCLLVLLGVSSGCRTVTGLYWFVTGLGFLELVGYWFVLGLTGMAPGGLLVLTGAYWFVLGDDAIANEEPPEGGTGEAEEKTWMWWHKFRTLCDYNKRVAL